MKKGDANVLRNKSGQVTIFIIIAIVIVGAGVLFFFVLPDSRVTVSEFDEGNPEAFMQTCLSERVEEVVRDVSMQGGSLEPENYFTYNDIKIEYLCYTNQELESCVVQQPLLRQHIETEIEDAIKGDVQGCFDSLQSNYEERGYNANLNPGVTKVELLPERIVIDMNYILTVSKTETERFDEFEVDLNNNLYELVSIATSIIDWETTLGDADPRIYGRLDPDMRVNKNLRDEGTKIYTITELSSGNSFQLASRSLAFPVGY